MQSKIILKFVAFCAILLSAVNAFAVTLEMNVGTLQLGVPNNEFLAGVQSEGDGFIQPMIYFSANNGPIAFGPTGATYAESENLSYTFEYSFDFSSAAKLTPNSPYCTCTYFAPASAVLMQESNIIATASSLSGSGFRELEFPAIYVAANTQYKLVITEFGPSENFVGGVGLSQIALDVSAIPEPTQVLLIAVGLAILQIRRSKRVGL